MYDLAEQLKDASVMVGEELKKGLSEVDVTKLKDLLIAQKMILESMMMVKHINNNLTGDVYKE